jgi:hypothetical protein
MTPQDRKFYISMTKMSWSIFFLYALVFHLKKIVSILGVLGIIIIILIIGFIFIFPKIRDWF